MKGESVKPENKPGTDSEGSKKRSSKLELWFDKISKTVAWVTGRPITSIVAFCVVILWAVSGPIFDYSDTWQLFINTSTTIITFLMVFIIQQSQNKDTMAIQLKLNELIACQKNASNRLIDIEDLTEDELEVLKKFYVRLSKLAQKENELHTSHSIDEAIKAHEGKKKAKPGSLA